MSTQDTESLRRLLYTLVTPQTEEEAEIFRGNHDMIDEQCYILNRLDTMSHEELVREINLQLRPQGLQLG